MKRLTASDAKTRKRKRPTRLASERIPTDLADKRKGVERKADWIGGSDKAKKCGVEIFITTSADHSAYYRFGPELTPTEKIPFVISELRQAMKEFPNGVLSVKVVVRNE